MSLPQEESDMGRMKDEVQKERRGWMDSKKHEKSGRFALKSLL